MAECPKRPKRVIPYSFDPADTSFEVEARAWASEWGIFVEDPVLEELVIVGRPDPRPMLTRTITDPLYREPIKARPAAFVTRSGRLEHPDLPWLPEEVEARGVQVARLGQAWEQEPRRRRSGRQKSRESVAERLLRGRKASARAGKHQSGPAPYGYQRDYSKRATDGVKLVIHPPEAEVIRRIFREYLRRKSLKKLIEHLDSLGLKTRRKKRWSRAGLSWILKNETYLGRVHFGDIRSKGQHPALIAPIVFNKVQKLIRKNNKRIGNAKKGAS